MVSSALYLGISADFHDSAAAVIVDGDIVAAAEEERFSRVKHDPALPEQAIAWCLARAGAEASTAIEVVFYEKPMTAYERLLATHALVGPRGIATLRGAIGQWSLRKLWVRLRIERTLRSLGLRATRIRFAEHHQSHAAAAFFPSPFESAAILTCDGVGEWATSTMGWGSGRRIEVTRELWFPDSVGLWYSAMTAFCGLTVNDGEGSLMGLAPYGSPRFVDILRERVIDIADDGSIRLDQRWFDYRSGRAMVRPRLSELLDGPAQPAGEPPGEREADIACSTQVILEEVMLRMGVYVHEMTRESRLCLAGGVALNCAANARLLDKGPFEEIWIQPAAGDAGSAVGAALWGWHQLDDETRVDPVDRMRGSFLGPSFTAEEVADWLEGNDIPHQVFETAESLCAEVAAEIADGLIVGWFQGAMEFGPRALGHRSILADPRDPSVTARLNLAVKGREGFRPFAPSVLAEDCAEWFDVAQPSPYMLLTAPVATHRLRTVTFATLNGAERDLASLLALDRSEIPACTHVDHSARIHTVEHSVNPEFHRLLTAFKHITGCPVLVNTSFNHSGEPIVRTPADALRCFVATNLDLLVLERCLVRAADVEGLLAS